MTTVLPLVKRGTGGFVSTVGDDGALAVTGLPGDVLRMVSESTELADLLLSTLARENVECTELTSVLEVLPGSRFMIGRIGVDGLTGSGTLLGRRKGKARVLNPKLWGAFPCELVVLAVALALKLLFR